MRMPTVLYRSVSMGWGVVKWPQYALRRWPLQRIALAFEYSVVPYIYAYAAYATLKSGSHSDTSTSVALRSVALLRTTSIENVLY